MYGFLWGFRAFVAFMAFIAILAVGKWLLVVIVPLFLAGCLLVFVGAPVGFCLRRRYPQKPTQEQERKKLELELLAGYRKQKHWSEY